MGPWPISDLWIMNVTRSSLPIWIYAFSLVEDVVAASSLLLSGRWNATKRPPTVAAPAFRKSRRPSLVLDSTVTLMPHLLPSPGHFRRPCHFAAPRLDTAPPDGQLDESPGRFRNDRCCRAWPRRYRHQWGARSSSAD